jgi:hypothetical protein
MCDLKKLEIIDLLSKFFEEDKVKALQWLSCPNLELGGVRPSVLIKAGKEDMVLNHVRKHVYQYIWPSLDHTTVQ